MHVPKILVLEEMRTQPYFQMIIGSGATKSLGVCLETLICFGINVLYVSQHAKLLVTKLV